MRRLIFIISCFIITLTICPGRAAYAQKKKPQTPNWTTMWNWTTASWGSDDTPYQQIRSTVDHATKAGRDPLDLMQYYQMLAIRNPNDPKAQFRWAYAAYVAAKQMAYSHSEDILYWPNKALVLAPFPHTYQYARLIFLIESHASGPFILRLQNVSKRLMKQNPSDIDVKYEAAGNLLYSSNPTDRELASRYIRELTVSQPHWAKPYALAGLVLYKHWQDSKSKADAAQAVACYQQYLKLTPATDTFRQRAQEIIAEMQKG